jgi:hypothetical protein
MFPIVGFDSGGPLRFRTFGANQGKRFVTYVSCELAIRSDQLPSLAGPYDLLCSCDDPHWVRTILSEIGRMSLRTVLGMGHTIDIGPKVGADAPIQAVMLEGECGTTIANRTYIILRVIGITRPELGYERQHGFESLLKLLKTKGVYPNTEVNRHSVV